MEFPFIDIHTHRTGSDHVAIYSYRIGDGTPLPDVPHSAGVHPWDADTAARNALDGITGPGLVAIGETGLDFAARSRKENQTVWFEKQLELAQKLNLPIIIHCVKAYNTLIRYIDGYPQPVIIHGFTGSSQLASQLLSKGCYLSFGEGIFHSPKTIGALQATPLDRLFLETDTSDLSIEEIYLEAVSITSHNIETLKMSIYDNYQKIFRIK